MSKLRVFSGAELCDLLGHQGFERVRQRGSHVVMRRGPVSFPVPLHRELAAVRSVESFDKVVFHARSLKHRVVLISVSPHFSTY
jgi:predicted RNA binding protein YcfA (HicA-like mRNA interferase family)